MTYLEKLQHPKWQKKRLEVLSRDNFTCKFCSDKESTLHVHHYKYNGNPWDANLDDLETLCCDCHALAEWAKKEELQITYPLNKRLQPVKGIVFYVMPFTVDGNATRTVDAVAVIRSVFGVYDYMVYNSNIINVMKGMIDG